MRIQLLSDLHNEVHGEMSIPETEADLIVLAGDIDVGTKGLLWAYREGERLGKPVVYVAGNHEYYDNEMQALDCQLDELAVELNLFYLSRHEALIDGIRFLGVTLWTDYLCSPAPLEATMSACQKAMFDHKKIRFGARNFSAHDARERHIQEVSWLDAELAKDTGLPTVVVTHHAPSLSCQHPQYDFDAMTAAFQSDLDHLIGKADLWLYGHTHHCFDGLVAGTRVVSNQRGYRYERTGGFDSRKLIEVPGVKGDCDASEPEASS